MCLNGFIVLCYVLFVRPLHKQKYALYLSEGKNDVLLLFFKPNEILWVINSLTSLCNNIAKISWLWQLSEQTDNPQNI